MQPHRPAPFVLQASSHGTMIVNRHDYKMIDEHSGFGVGWQLMTTSVCEGPEVDLLAHLLRLRRKHYGDGVYAVDCGANIGTVTVSLATECYGWGQVLAFEAQERIFYALAGNLALNNCLNARAMFAAVGATDGTLEVPRIDSLGLPRLDLLKVDVEGMEFDVLAGADATIRELHPVMLIEHIKVDGNQLLEVLRGWGYEVMPAGVNVLAVHTTDPILGVLRK